MSSRMISILLEHVDWLATMLVVLGSWFIGSRQRKGYAFHMVGCSLWIVWASTHLLFSICVVNVVFLFLAIRGWILWRKA